MPTLITNYATQKRDGRAFDEVSNAIDKGRCTVASETHDQQEQQSSKAITPVLTTQNSATFWVDRVSSIAHTDSPPIPAWGEFALPAAHYPPIPSDPACNPPPRPAGIGAIPATGENESEAEEAGEQTQCSIDSWMGDAKTVLKFNGVFIPTIASFIIESYKFLSPNIGHQILQNPSPLPAAPILLVNVMWLISLVLSITSTLFATSTLMLQTQLPQVDHMHSRSYVFLGTVSVLLFLTGLVIFLFTIDKIVGIVVLIVLIAVGLFGVVYFVLRPCSCRGPTAGCP